MTDKQILEYAMKGILAEIHELEKDIRRGYKLIEQIDNGGKVKTTKSKQEILDIIKEKKKRVEYLDKEKFNISWKVEVDMKEE